MIFGVGTDMVELSRVERLWQLYGEHFARRILMPEELGLFSQSRQPVRVLAMRFAAKEAVVKALGTGFRYGIWVRDTGSVPDRRGRPLVLFSKRGRGVCNDLGVTRVHVSLSDEAGMVLAFAVAETGE